MAGPKEYDIEEAFRVIEDEILESLKRRLERGITPEGITDESIEKEYGLWQTEQLKALQQYRYTDDKYFKEKYSKLNEKIRQLIEDTADITKLREVHEILKKVAGIEKRQDSEELELINREKLDALINATVNDIQKAEYATLRMMDDQYRKIIFNAQVYLNTGSGTLRNAIDMAARDFYASGINSIQYKNGARVNIGSYSEMALRTANRRATLQGSATARDMYDLHLVIINNRGVMCPKCAQYRNRVCIDDVFGNGKPDGKHPLLSSFMAGGLYHPNCKDSHTTYYEGISQPPTPPTKAEQEEANRIYNLEQRQRYNERQIRKYKRLETCQLDPDNKARAKAKRQEWQKRQREFVEQNKELRRKYDREKVY